MNLKPLLDQDVNDIILEAAHKHPNTRLGRSASALCASVANSAMGMKYAQDLLGVDAIVFKEIHALLAGAEAASQKYNEIVTKINAKTAELDQQYRDSKKEGFEGLDIPPFSVD